jgi:hypothetical protein
MSFMPIFVHRFFSFTPSKPRHPLLRLVLGLLGLVLLALLVVFGLFIGLGMLLFAGIRRMLRRQPVADAPAGNLEGVIDGEFSVIDKNRASLGLR